MNLGVIILLFNSLLSGKVSGRSAVHAILKMDPQLYTEILRGDFVKTLGDYELDMSESTFQQDNDPKRTSLVARKWLKTNSVEVLE